MSIASLDVGSRPFRCFDDRGLGVGTGTPSWGARVAQGSSSWRHLRIAASVSGERSLTCPSEISVNATLRNVRRSRRPTTKSSTPGRGGSITWRASDARLRLLPPALSTSIDVGVAGDTDSSEAVARAEAAFAVSPASTGGPLPER